MKYTQGPWKISPIRTKNEFGTIGIDITSKNYRDFATVWNMEGMEEENEANAKLISAAPDLLEALIEIRKHGLLEKDGYESVVKIMNEAIKKATE